MHQIAVPPCLGQHALARVDQDYGQIGSRCARDHVARVLFMAGCVGHDELALLGGEKAIGHVDGDALLAFCGQPIDQQRKVDIRPLRAHLGRVRLQRGKLVFEDHLAVIQQPPDQRGFPVIHGPAGDETQQRLVLVRGQIGVDIFGNQGIGDISAHQKYPSCFFFSMLADWSWSIARPCRSDVVASSISRITSGKVAAVLSTAPDSG